ncbi:MULTISPECIES: TetR/AcrR family transcriptional regulator [Bacillus]|uniref:TetR/AcrR family transcriptional regulator n=1 Tax=Bacillus TaxID=1386 RepID=UPI000BB79BF1|nr:MULTISPECIES: TetR/AcrR family transcriptional regulator [Bacillus]
MHERKKQVLKKAHKLFVKKGFHSTSIQDILDDSGISKGTFYNYFSSKNELIISIFQLVYDDFEKERNELLIGHKRSDQQIFIQQMVLQLKTNRVNHLVPLFEELVMSKDEDLKQFILDFQLKMLGWIFERFTDLFGVEKKKYLLDCSIMFTALLQQTMKYERRFSGGYPEDLHKIVSYCLKRVTHQLPELEKTEETLFNPSLLLSRLQQENSQQMEIYELIQGLKKKVDSNVRAECEELLDFIYDELVDTKKPRKYLLHSAVGALESLFSEEVLEELKQYI